MPIQILEQTKRGPRTRPCRTPACNVKLEAVVPLTQQQLSYVVGNDEVGGSKPGVVLRQDHPPLARVIPN